MVRLIVTRLAPLALLVVVVALVALVHAHETDITIADPGFRPESEYANTFLDTVNSSTVAVYPTLVRRETRTAHDFLSQERAAAFINEQQIAAAVTVRKRVDLGAPRGNSQWELFQSDLNRIADALQRQLPDAQYHLLLEFVLPTSDQEIFGVHCYILDQHGQNAFSFLLNSHHELFVDGKLVAKNSSEAARAEMMARATEVVLQTLHAQLDQARAAAQP